MKLAVTYIALFLIFFMMVGIPGAQDSGTPEPSSSAIPVSIYFQNVVLATAVNGDQPTGINTRFKTDDPRIVLWFQYYRDKTAEKLPVSVYWIKDKIPRFVVQTWLEVDSGICWFSMESFCYFDHPGTWVTEIRSSDQILLMQNFRIEKTRPPAKVEILPVPPERDTVDEIVDNDSPDSADSAEEDEIKPPDNKIRIEVKASDFDRGNFKRHHLLYSNLTVSSFEVPSWAEYDLNVPVTGIYELWWAYTAAESRPTKFYFDGMKLTDMGLSGITGGWYKETVKWFKELQFRISSGKHVLRIENLRNVPCLESFVLVLTSVDPEFD